MLELTDTHCHIQEVTVDIQGDAFMRNKWHKAGITNPVEVIGRAKNEGVTKLICVGTTLDDSKLAVTLAQKQGSCWSSIGIHPHEAEDHNSNQHLEDFARLATEKKVVAVGECGLDYYYQHSPQKHQQAILEFQLQLAQKHQLPLIFHIREAFEDFFDIFDNFSGLRGVVHSFTGNSKILEQCLKRGLYIGLNGIMTFTKDQAQLEAAKHVPLEKLVLETDAPFLTPAPERGTICEPKHVRVTAEFLSNLRSESLEQLSRATTNNAQALFNI